MILISVQIDCDAAFCAESFHFTASPETVKRKMDAPFEQGWERVGGKVYCPGCANNPRRQAETTRPQRRLI